MSKHEGLLDIEKSKYHYFGRYKGCEIQLDKELGEDWYIIVKGQDGINAYDGWWPHSSNASVDQAIDEAFYGAQL